MENIEPGMLLVPEFAIGDEPTNPEEPSSMPQLRTAASPFDRLAADVVLQSSDKVNFHVYKTVLLLASSFFETMFSLQQPSSETDNASPQPPEPPLIAVSEDSETLDALLRFCYPVDDPTMQTLEQLDKVLEAASKYDIHVVVNVLRRTLQTFIPAYPREAFAVACRHTLEEEAQKAAQAWKAVTRAQATAEDFRNTFAGATFIPAMSGVSAGAYHRLLSYLRTGRLPVKMCSPSVPVSPQTVTSAEPFSAPGGDIILKSSTSARVYKIHRLVLTINDLDLLLANALPAEAIDNLPVYQVAPDITSDVLEKLLLLCYPDGFTDNSHSGPIHPSTYGRLMEIATRYEMHAIIRTLRRNWSRHAAPEPLAFYIIAVRYGWLAEAQEAANNLLDTPLDDVYSPELEKATAAIYQSLLKFHHLYRVTVMRGIAKHGKKKEGYHTYDVTDSTNAWTKGWLGDSSSSGKYLRNIPFIVVELYAQMYRDGHSGAIGFQKIATETQAVEKTIKRAALNVRIDIANLG